MNVRPPARAGSFYEVSPDACRQHAESLLGQARLPGDLPPAKGGIVPHAGWVFSGRLAAMTLKAVAPPGEADTVVFFGADHTGRVARGEVYNQGGWRTPLGVAEIDEPLAAALIATSDALRANPDAHTMEHSIEVQVPLLQMLSPGAKIVPVAVPPTALSLEVGQTVGQTLMQNSPNARVIGSTDLTHHGGHFGDYLGRGEAGVRASEENDRRMLERIEALDAEGVIAEAEARGNACGAGAIAATIAACLEMGATSARVLEYTNSHEVMKELQPRAGDYTTVGYASVVFV